MGPETLKFHKVLAGKIADKKGEQYGRVLGYIRSSLSVHAVRSMILCLRGTSSYKKVPEVDLDNAHVDLFYRELNL